MNRREFGKSAARVAAAAVGIPIAGACYGFAAGTHLAVTRPALAVPNLPGRFEGLRVAFLTDIHHGPFVTAEYVAGLVRTTAMLAPDLVLLGGDFSLRESKYIAPCLELLAALRARHGVFAVLGNHDYAHGLDATRAGLKRAKIAELTNRGTWLADGPDRLMLCGVDDHWHGRPDADAALTGATANDCVLMLCHNPDFAETLADRRVGLMFSGHTHGGQIVVPGYGAAVVPSRYGQKYARGLVEAPATKVYVSAGTGMSILPVRVNCQPEIVLATLTRAG